MKPDLDTGERDDYFWIGRVRNQNQHPSQDEEAREKEEEI
jgi:hypothetical protein